MEADQQLFRIGNELANELIFQLTSTKFSGQFPYRRASLFFFCRAFKAYQAVAMLGGKDFLKTHTRLLERFTSCAFKRSI